MENILGFFLSLKVKLGALSIYSSCRVASIQARHFLVLGIMIDLIGFAWLHWMIKLFWFFIQTFWETSSILFRLSIFFHGLFYIFLESHLLIEGCVSAKFNLMLFWNVDSIGFGGFTLSKKYSLRS
jgi:hypothetical protein